MGSKTDKKRVARKRKNERARADRTRKVHAERRRQRTAPLSEVWGGKDTMDGKDVHEKMKKVSMRRVLARFEADRPELVEELRPLIARRGRPPGSGTCRTLGTALTLAAWAEYAELPDFAPMVMIGPQKDIRVGCVGTEEDAVGHGMSVRYDDYNPVLFLQKTGKVGAVSYRRDALGQIERFLAQPDPKMSALLLDLTHGGSTIRKEAILDGELVPDLDASPGPKKDDAPWDEGAFRAAAAVAEAAVAALVPPEPLVKWRVERRDDHRELLTNEDGGWRPFDSREDAEAALPDDSWHALETPVVTPGVDPPRALKARDAAARLLESTPALGPCMAAERVEAAAKALGKSDGAWGDGPEKEAFEAAGKALEAASEAASGRPSTPSVAVWLRSGSKEQDGSDVYAKAGYLPLWMHEEKAHVVAESFLPCGAPGTPEHGMPGMGAMGSPDATLADLAAAYGSQETVMALAEAGLEPLIAVRDGRGERPTFAPLAGFEAGTEERLSWQ